MALAENKSPSYIPTREEITKLARDLIPELKERAQQAEDLRKMPEENVAALKKAGIHKIFTPKRYGGYEMDWGTQVDVARELGKGCASTSWMSSVVMSHSWNFGRFPAEAQEEFWPTCPDAVIATAFAGGGEMIQADGGFILNGLWRFASGVDHSDASIVAGQFKNANSKSGTALDYRMALIMPDQYEIIDTWHAEGLKGTGSKDIKVVDAFVPEYRTIKSLEMGGKNPPGSELHDSYIYRVEMGMYFNTLLSGPTLGTTHGLMNDYLDQTRSRFGVMLGEKVSEQESVQQKIGESYEELRMADMIVDELCNFLHEKGSNNETIMGNDRLKVRRETSMASKLCMSSGNRLAGMMGVSSQTGRNATQRHFRDLRTMSMHGGVHWENATTPTGRYLLGIETGDKLIDQSNPYLEENE
ncbi:MAG TPA: acyl-CoA dehydrogenase family protein [Gammaproteobacteria bacterium]|jgi:3-hydroxy-9,10-secoandrosta-1,3,5(10)-triene-9,17-dione monooxygenase|nr:acyl-CoA dehydrogenase family protein [Gammaproteobacteria bacterium]